MNLWMLIPQLCSCGGTCTLRIYPQEVMNQPIEYLTYECRLCLRLGGLSITEPEAAAHAP